MIEKTKISLVKQPVSTLSGVGPRTAERLSKIGVVSIQDLLFHLPLSYQDRTRCISLKDCIPGQRILVRVEIESARVLFGRRRSLLCRANGDGVPLFLRFFYFNQAMQKKMSQKGEVLRCFGEIRKGPYGLEMVHPECLRVDEDHEKETLNDVLTPIYPTTQGLQQTSLRRLMLQALNYLRKDTHFKETLPDALCQKLKLCDLPTALQILHQPPKDCDVKELLSGNHFSQRRLIFEELLAHRLSLLQSRQSVHRQKALVLKGNKEKVASFFSALPYQLTSAQKRVLNEIVTDLKSGMPMLRLLQGDVGSGKTVVAALSILHALGSGVQAAFMAPTELLAEQHYRQLHAWFSPLGIRVGWLSGSLTAKQKREQYEQIADGQVDVVIGTHALFQAAVVFKKLALIIVDEQHRFGVEQRLALWQKGVVDDCYPHQLVMSATPIPRTLTMTAYADLDCSVIDELPPGRQPIKTVVMNNKEQEQLLTRVAEQCRVGAQCYWVCTLIDTSEVLRAEAAEVVAEQMRVSLSDLRIGLVHGRLSADEKESVMAAFRKHELDILVATTVIEVGVDVPNASLMVIENSERLGLAQLHQLRGRVGRGSKASHCVLMYQSPLSKQAQQRLVLMRESQDGFVIAEQDWQMRGPGEILGKKQSGLVQLKMADLQRDEHLMPLVTEAAEQLLAEHQDYAKRLIIDWFPDIELFSV